MRDTSSRSYACALLTSCLLAACADDATHHLGKHQQALAGPGAVFWQPFDHELFTDVIYCFEANDFDDAARARIGNALEETWSRVANIDFHDEGWCGTAPDADQAVKIILSKGSGFGWTQPSGTRLRGLNGYVQVPYLATGPEDMTCPKELSRERCATASIVHEFAHVLGFGHESGSRADFDANPDRPNFARDCPNTNPARLLGTTVLDADTLITPFDKDSITEFGYCRVPDNLPLLSELDIAGVQAIYGGPDVVVHYTTDQAPFFSALRFHQGPPAPGGSNALYLSAADSGDATWRQRVEHAEHMRIVPIGERSDSVLQYGDMVAIVDESGRYLSARDDGWLTFVENLGEWEQWSADTINGFVFPDDFAVPVNAPVRLRNPYFDAAFTVESNGDLRLTTDPVAGVWRINGPFTDD